MAKIPRVSVCIPAYNHEKYISQTITSVLNQGIDDLEIVITDDCSSDATVSAINSINDSRIRLFRHSRNQGPSVAANNNIVNSQGEYVCFVPSDDIFLPHKISKQLAVLEEDPGIGAVFSQMQYIDEAGSLLEQKDNVSPAPRRIRRKSFFGTFSLRAIALPRRQPWFVGTFSTRSDYLTLACCKLRTLIFGFVFACDLISISFVSPSFSTEFAPV